MGSWIHGVWVQGYGLSVRHLENKQLLLIPARHISRARFLCDTELRFGAFGLCGLVFSLALSLLLPPPLSRIRTTPRGSVREVDCRDCDEISSLQLYMRRLPNATSPVRH